MKRDEILSYADLFWHLEFDPHLPRTIKPSHSEELPPNSANASPPFSKFRNNRPSPGPLNLPFDISKITPNKSTPKLFGLFIGIDNYAHTKKLKGAAADARNMRDYFKARFKVPDDQIKELFDEKASRKNIIDAFFALANNDFKNSKIEPGNAILIFYAGHGDLITAPSGWRSGRPDKKIQSIVPHDFCESKVDVIPDRTIGSLIDIIAEKHGDNITVIFDCCHSGSGTRKDDESVRAVGLDEDYSISPTLDAEVWQSSQSRGMASATGLAATGLESHIFLSACSANELAREDLSNGRFTTALLKVFNTVSPDQLTYSQAIGRLDHIPGQNPQLEGKNRHRIFFNAQASSPYRACYSVRHDPIRGFFLNAGAVHGVSVGAEFTVYKDEQHLLLDPVVGVLTVSSVTPFESKMVITHDCPLFTLTSEAVAIQTKAGKDQELKLHVPLTDEYLPVFQALLLVMKGTGPNPRKVALVDRSVANLEAERRGDEIFFNIFDTRVKEHGGLPIPRGVKADSASVLPVIEVAAHYYYHLNRTTVNALVQKHVKVEMFELVDSDLMNEDTGRKLLQPTGENIIVDGRISRDMCPHTESKFGISIKNTSALDLYPTVFYFDNSNLSINSFHTTDEEGGILEIDSPLPKGGELTLGYGSGGTRDLELFMSDGQDIDTGFLKIFVSSKAVDLSNVSQPSPFGDPDPNKSDDRGLQARKPRKPEIWGSIIIPVFLTRRCNHAALVP